MDLLTGLGSLRDAVASEKGVGVKNTNMRYESKGQAAELRLVWIQTDLSLHRQEWLVAKRGLHLFLSNHISPDKKKHMLKNLLRAGCVRVKKIMELI